MSESPTPRADAFAVTTWMVIDPKSADDWLGAHSHLSGRELADEARKRHGDEIAKRWQRVGQK